MHKSKKNWKEIPTPKGYKQVDYARMYVDYYAYCNILIISFYTDHNYSHSQSWIFSVVDQIWYITLSSGVGLGFLAMKQGCHCSLASIWVASCLVLLKSIDFYSLGEIASEKLYVTIDTNR